MGITSENVASAYNISRRKQDEYSVLVSVERGGWSECSTTTHSFWCLV